MRKKFKQILELLENNANVHAVRIYDELNIEERNKFHEYLTERLLLEKYWDILQDEHTN